MDAVKRADWLPTPERADHGCHARCRDAIGGQEHVKLIDNFLGCGTAVPIKHRTTISIEMLIWKPDEHIRIVNRLQQLGLTKCPICEGETLSFPEIVVVLYVGGIPTPKSELPPAPDTETEIIRSASRQGTLRFMIQVLCEVCGHSMLFDSERHSSGDTPMFGATS